jgi:hypothetical protein
MSNTHLRRAGGLPLVAGSSPEAGLGPTVAIPAVGSVFDALHILPASPVRPLIMVPGSVANDFAVIAVR